jgi:hypothetical protein
MHYSIESHGKFLRFAKLIGYCRFGSISLDLTNNRKRYGWLSKQAPKVLIALATRAALRMLPFVGESISYTDSSENDPISTVILPTFRANAVCVLSATSMELPERFKTAALDASVAAHDASEAAPFDLGSQAAFVAATAAEAAMALQPNDSPDATIDGYAATIFDCPDVDLNDRGIHRASHLCDPRTVCPRINASAALVKGYSS